ncbi:hypothetical protein N7524_010457 [Penicillium chrysogenum]|nr:hypothetical protein N7524_010457 [Penicillium chrysogenum]
MSELFESQQSKTVPYCNDRPPQYDPCQPSQDVLTSVIENEHTRRILVQRVDEWNRKALSLSDITPIGPGYFQAANFCLEMKLANVYKERTVRNIELYTAMEGLTESEFNRTYASLGRDANQQMRHQLAQDYEDHGDCSREGGYNSKQIEPARDCTCDSRDQFFELSAKVDKINDKLSQSLQSLDTASVSKETHNAPPKPPKSFWKRILKHSAQH